MVQEIPLTTDAVTRLIQRIEDESKRKLAAEWNQSMANGDVCFGRPIGFNCRRLYLNAAAKFWKLLKSDLSNLYEAVVEAIESCRPDQYSTRKHIKEAGISLTKFLIHKELINE